MLRKLHGGILGICALIDSFPYTVEKWTPELLTDVLNRHTYDPVTIYRGCYGQCLLMDWGTGSCFDDCSGLCGQLQEDPSRYLA
jgi:hypothetical protein